MDAELKESVDQYVQSDHYGDAEKDGRAAALQKVVGALATGKAQLLDLVLYLEPALNDTSNPQGRRHSIQLLADCLRDPAAEMRLNLKHVETFVVFFCSKLCDWQCVEGSTTGLASMLRRQAPQLRTLKASDGSPIVTDVARALFKGVHTPSHTQHVRKCVLDLAHLLLSEWREEVSLLREGLGEGITTAIEEERDPRNLLLSFSIAKQLLRDCEPECVSDETLNTLFESLVSYFPITFTPPKNDKHGITGEDLKAALRGALSSTPRMAGLVVPFMLDNSKDITVGDNESAIKDALSMLAFCLERYGADTVRKHLGEVLTTARDQLCRTTTPCPDEFAEAVQRILAAAMSDVPAGLTPHWLGREVEPTLKGFAKEATKGRSSLAGDGSRRLIVAAARASPVLFQHAWAMTVPPLLGDAGPLPADALQLVLDLARAAAPRSLLTPKQAKPALAGAAAALLALEPGAEAKEEGLSADQAFAMAAELVGLLAQMAGEGASAEAFKTLCLLALPPAAGAADDKLAARWRAALVEAGEGDARAAALLAAVGGVVARQPARAMELAPALLEARPAQGAWPAPVLSRSLADAALSLAGAEPEGAAEVMDRLLRRGVELMFAGASSPEVLRIWAQALAEERPASGRAAERLVEILELPAGLPRLCAGLGGPDRAAAAAAVRLLVAALCARLPEAASAALRRGALDAAVSGEEPGTLALAPAVLVGMPALADWSFGQPLLKAACSCVTDPARAAHEPLALEALEAVLVASPAEMVEPLLGHFREAFEPVLRGGGGASTTAEVARGAARCWAAAGGALLRRGGFTEAADKFLKALLGALEEKDAPLTPFVPVAFQVMMPPSFDGGSESAASTAKLPPLALQQLSRTVLPSLLSVAKSAAAAAPAGVCPAGSAGMAALESAVTLLAALPAEVSCSDCEEEMRWCTLTALRYLGEESAESRVLAAQALQLLVRATKRGSAWVEDDLNAVVQPLVLACSSHSVPLVRLGCLQALKSLTEQSQGHMLTFKRQIEQALRKAVEDRKREVRLLAVACLNSWHCGMTADRV